MEILQYHKDIDLLKKLLKTDLDNEARNDIEQLLKEAKHIWIPLLWEKFPDRYRYQRI